MCIDAILVASISGSISLIVTVIWYNLRRSRCTNIQGGCFECTRQMMNTEELNEDKFTIPQI